MDCHAMFCITRKDLNNGPIVNVLVCLPSKTNELFCYLVCKPTSIKYKVGMRQAVSTLYRVRSLALQQLSAGNSAECSEADNSKTEQRRAMNCIYISC